MTDTTTTQTITISSLEAPDAAWWVCRRGTLPGQHPGHIDDEDARSIVGDVRVDTTPYPARHVGYGAIASALEPEETLGTDEGDGGPILTPAAVLRLAALPGTRVVTG